MSASFKATKLNSYMAALKFGYCPHFLDFIADLKNIIPAQCREFDAKQKIWYIKTEYLQSAVRLALSYFQNVIIVDEDGSLINARTGEIQRQLQLFRGEDS